MKRRIILTISSIIILTIMMFTSNAFAYDEDINETLRQLGVCPSNLTDEKLDDVANRGDMATVVSRLVEQGTKAATDTVFTDVTKDNPNSGYIQYAYENNIIFGTGDNKFNPDGDATADAVFVTILRALGYGSQFTSEEISFLSESIELTEDVYARGNMAITNREMLQIVYNALTVPMRRLDAVDSENIIDNYRNILSDVMGISVYKGTITEVTQKNNVLKFTVSENVYSNNNEVLAVGSNVSFTTEDDTLFMYENTPVYLWADKEGNVVRIYTQRRTQVSYEVVYAVNRDDSESSEYAIGGMNDIEFYGDKARYPVSEDATLIYNGDETELPVSIIGKFVKVVTFNGEVINIEGWDLTKGGLITENVGDYIQYSDSTTSGKRLKGILDNDEIRVIINGKASSYYDMKKDSVFNYFMEDEYVVIVNTETMISETFDKYTLNEIELGGESYDCRNTAYSDNGEDYSVSKYYSIYGMVVDAFFDETNKCVFVRASESDANAENYVMRKFMAVVDKCYFDEETETRKIRLFVLEPSVSKQEFDMVKDSKMKYYDDITVDDLQNNARNYNAAGVYEFEVNGKNEIKSVRKPAPYYGVQNSLFTYDSLSEDLGYPTIDGVADGIVTKLVAFKSSRYFVLREENGEFNVAECEWNDIRNTVPISGTTPKLLLIGDEKKTNPKMVIVCNAHNLMVRNSVRYGVLQGNEAVWNSETESEMHEIVLNGQTYVVSKELGMSLPERGILKYNPVLGFSKDPLDIAAFIDIEGPISTWTLPDGSTSIENFFLIRDRVSYIDDIRVCFDSIDSGYAYYRYNGTYKYISSSDELVAIERDEIAVGDTVICGMTDTVKFMILVD